MQSNRGIGGSKRVGGTETCSNAYGRISSREMRTLSSLAIFVLSPKQAAGICMLPLHAKDQHGYGYGYGSDSISRGDRNALAYQNYNFFTSFWIRLWRRSLGHEVVGVSERIIVDLLRVGCM
mmetsp:Transcript_21368/g.50610  ORF Transcript_21368/g.50610 Transcript_21368/m.50610 type:complete len:122 (+) Transcript_21368:278-643(+)